MVWHSGAAASGEFVHSLQMIDVTTGWSERVATLGRSYRVVKDGFKRILTRLPFPVKEIHPDNGSEFLNNLWSDSGRRLLVGPNCPEAVPGIKMTIALWNRKTTA